MEPVNLDLYLRRAGDHHRAQVSEKDVRGHYWGGQAKRPKTVGPLSYAKAAQEGIRTVVVCNGRPEGLGPQSKLYKHFTSRRWVCECLPEEGFTPGSSTSTGQKGL